jgi:outer membrane protein assembly factor BamB
MKGASKEVAVNSPEALFHVTAPFEAAPNTWYHMKTRVDIAADGSGIIRGKIWKKDEAEPDAWTIEAHHQHANHEGSPGLFAFAPQKRVYIDNVTVTSNEK